MREYEEIIGSLLNDDVLSKKDKVETLKSWIGIINDKVEGRILDREKLEHVVFVTSLIKEGIKRAKKL
ncbi:hypothetical protein [Oceanispirochaeta sp.]|jgi:hypothetical protein|uniref:hypothetical protein n=1 Tax=Oceanispirochaeta sp. TaxID=2035350 RepID=UPI002615B23F|nr:hypothetical protein [Oceanispirochaeta sp.]MDA3956878.1 hypothetical protein [Oceanispirochaeta sp.]